MSKNKKPLMYVFAGNNGSGKSTIRNLLVDKIGLETNIDPDAMARYLTPDQRESMNIKAGKLAIKQTEDCIINRKSFSVETTLSGKIFIKKLALAKEHGFNITMFYLGLRDVTQNIKRISLRVQNGGHDIPTKDILKRQVKSKENLLAHLSLIDNLVVMDNSDFTGEVMLEAYDNIISYESSDLPDWVKPIRDELKSQP